MTLPFLEPEEDIPPHVARIIRDKTIKNTGEAVTAGLEYAAQRCQSQKPDKVVKIFVDTVFEELNSRGVALMKGIQKHPRYKKRTVGMVGTWEAHSDFLNREYLYAQYRVASRLGQASLFQEVRVSHHAIERVVERNKTISQQAVRDELAVACNGVLLASMQDPAPKNGTHLKVETPNGIAIVVWNDARLTVGTIPCTTIKTWISYDEIKPGSHLIADPFDQYEEPERSPVTMTFVGGTPSLPRPTEVESE